ncbi:Glucan endo-1,3-beta-D-glucosidase [Handroanthus impetiginosus]|uniref:Glucan endo-1,3-beta-D-glucosidase n=1 Tax=Handroanthus impetiginosus TaxID=429701 RepID=A0A2G9HU37_9LAMI|nr:Glucan endo-1,3-beta-D-glucosidase [Handroanthus impetiginosus]
MVFNVILFAAFFLASNFVADATIGINWGRHTAQRLVPATVVDLLLQNKVPEARIYTSQEDILKAFVGSGINLTLTIFNIQNIAGIDLARKWVQEKAQYFEFANIRRVYLGSHVFRVGLTDKPFLHMAIDTLETLQYAINEAGYGDQIKVTFPHTESVLNDNLTRPSDAEFNEAIKEEMARTLRILKQNNAPFVVEVFPIADVAYHSYDPEFAFIDNKSPFVIRDINNTIYTNVFEFIHDCFVWALIKAGVPDMEIIVGQVGWPTDGFPGANASTAERFFKGLLPYVASNKGTPMRPGAPIHSYVHALTDENKMPYYYPFARHWGIYRSNGEPKYKIDLTGQGRDIYPTKAKGIMHMPERWCVFNENTTDTQKVKKKFDEACTRADCTSLAMGGSCSQLTFAQNMSYAFNMYFQANFQDEEACSFEGLGKVVTADPSVGGCVFPVEVVRGEQEGDVAAEGSRLYQMPSYGIFVVLVSMLWALFYD